MPQGPRQTVLVAQRILELSSLGSTQDRPAKQRPNSSPPLPPSVVGQSRRVPFCAFNGGRDVFVDIGDKSWGVTVCQQWFGSKENGGAIRGENTLHVGDQFLSAGSNDFKARSVGTTAWIASPAETVELLDDWHLSDNANLLATREDEERLPSSLPDDSEPAQEFEGYAIALPHVGNRRFLAALNPNGNQSLLPQNGESCKMYFPDAVITTPGLSEIEIDRAELPSPQLSIERMIPSVRMTPRFGKPLRSG
ncbi:hypothetical protein NM208_g12076 [Fusarium decemcellulare]|uniref:Uncharacterized protein n=1 Tax=Fusarium decemcellulare TaxID=57161 RepID=A0ACC1RTI9_9HYPO|nr:hypothetical protein NM208_g12076 [Fusarium decemcellulare]